MHRQLTKPGSSKRSLPKKKKSLRMKERKVKDNFRLRKLVRPENAFQTLKKLVKVDKKDFAFKAIPAEHLSFIAEATIRDTTYTGKGRSHNAAKADVCG